jgi:hypothetical protein
MAPLVLKELTQYLALLLLQVEALAEEGLVLLELVVLVAVVGAVLAALELQIKVLLVVGETMVLVVVVRGKLVKPE